MNSPLQFNKITKKAVTVLLVVSLLLIPGLSFASYHSLGNIAPIPIPPPPPEAPGNLAPIPEPEEPEAPGDIAPLPEPEEPEAPGDIAPLPEPEEPEAPGDIAPVPETTEEEDAEAAEEELDNEQLILEAEEPETEAEEDLTNLSRASKWILFIGLLLAIALIWLLIKRRRGVSSNE